MNIETRHILELIRIRDAGWYLSGPLKLWLLEMQQKGINIVHNEVLLQREINEMYTVLCIQYRFFNEFNNAKQRFYRMVKTLVNELLVNRNNEITFKNVNAIMMASLYQSSVVLSEIKTWGENQ